MYNVSNRLVFFLFKSRIILCYQTIKGKKKISRLAYTVLLIYLFLIKCNTYNIIKYLGVSEKIHYFIQSYFFQFIKYRFDK